MPFLNRRSLTRTTERRDLTPRRFDDNLADEILAAFAEKLTAQDRRQLLRNDQLTRIAQAWQDIIGPLLASHSRPVRLYGDTLSVACDHPAFAMQVQMMQGKIFAAVNHKFQVKIKKLRTAIHPNIWQNMVAERTNLAGKKGDIISKPGKMATEVNAELAETLKILDELEQEFRQGAVS